MWVVTYVNATGHDIQKTYLDLHLAEIFADFLEQQGYVNIDIRRVLG